MAGGRGEGVGVGVRDASLFETVVVATVGGPDLLTRDSPTI